MAFTKTQPPPQFQGASDYSERQKNALYELWFSYNEILKKFLPFPDLNDETQTDYFYFGWESANGSWLIRRQSRVNSAYSEATITNNPTYATLTDAWVDRYILVYP